MGKREKGIEYDGPQMATVMWIPKNAVKLKVNAKCENGMHVTMKLDKEGIE